MLFAPRDSEPCHHTACRQWLSPPKHQGVGIKTILDVWKERRECRVRHGFKWRCDIYVSTYVYMYILLHYIYIWEGFLLHPVDCGNHVEMSWFFSKKHEPVREEIGIPERMPEIIQSLDWGSPTTCTDTSWCSIASPGDKGTGASTKIKGTGNIWKPWKKHEKW